MKVLNIMEQATPLNPVIEVPPVKVTKEKKPREKKTASKDSQVNVNHRGLSPSSLSLYQGCARKYFLKKIAKVDIDPDAEESTEPFDVGKAFHQCLEDTKHELAGFSYADCKKVVVDKYKLDESTHLPMIFAMLGKYKSVHEKSGLKAIACEICIDTPEFYGFVDVVLQDQDGGWWLGDNKTASSYSPSIIPGLPRHQQLNLYAAHAPYIAAKLCLDLAAYKGCRYLITTKSKIARKKGEETKSYIARLSESVKSLDIVLPAAAMAPEVAYSVHAEVVAKIKKSKGKEADYAPNFGNCFSYFRNCEMFSRCHGRTATEIGKDKSLAVLEG